MVATKFGTFLIKFGRTFFRAAALFLKLLARRTFRLAALAAACGRTALSNPGGRGDVSDGLGCALRMRSTGRTLRMFSTQGRLS